MKSIQWGYNHMGTTSSKTRRQNSIPFEDKPPSYQDKETNLEARIQAIKLERGYYSVKVNIDKVVNECIEQVVVSLEKGKSRGVLRMDYSVRHEVLKVLQNRVDCIRLYLLGEGIHWTFVTGASGGLWV